MGDNINGIINIYKEQGFTSFDVVAKLRGILKTRKIGHTGTLDPDATGVLPVVVGNATKLVDMLTDKKKEYIATFILGKTTTTQDISGEITDERDVAVNEDEIREAIKSFIGDISQVPPMYSALKVDGKRLYELAREGKVVERKARPVTIHDIEIIDIDIPNVKMRVGCSKGTYIRTLCNDIGEKLGCGATMTSLERTQSGMFDKSSALTLSQIEEVVKSGDLDKIMIPVDSVFGEYAKAMLTGENLRLALNGNILRVADIKDCISNEGSKDNIRVYDEEGRFFAVYTKNKNTYKIDKMFPN